MPDNTSVVTLPTVLAAIGNRIDAAYERTKCGRQEWIEGSLELATALLEGRERMGNVAFGAWLRDNGHDHVERHQRQALLNLGRDPALMRTVLMETDSGSYVQIWDAVRIRYPDIGRTNSARNPANTGNRSNVQSTGRGPWTNVIDARLTVLFNRGTTRDDTARILSEEFDYAFTKGMVINATRRLGLVERPPARPAPTTPRPAPPRLVLPDRAAITAPILTPEQIDPEFTGTREEFMEHHGHVRMQTAEQQATEAFTALAAEFRTNVRTWRDYATQMTGSRNPISFQHPYWNGWLRSPRSGDITKIREALERLRPKIAEAEAALARAVEATAPPTTQRGLP